MTWEFETVFPRLASHGVLSSNDGVIAHSLGGMFRQNAFPAFCSRHTVDWATLGNLGMLFPQGPPPGATTVTV